MKRTKPVRRLIFATAMVLAFAASVFLFCKAGPWLSVDDPVPSRIDVIFTFGGKRRAFPTHGNFFTVFQTHIG